MDNYDDTVAESYCLGDLVKLLSDVGSEEHAECLSPVASEEMENALHAVGCYIKRVSRDLMGYNAQKITVPQRVSPATAASK